MDDVNTAIAPVGWDPDAVNPSTGAPFDSSWSGLVFLSREDDQFTNGRRENGLYCASFGRKVQNLENRVADFLRYEAAQGRRTMVASQFELEIDAFLNDCLTRTPEAATVRASDPRYVVHSTSQEAWASISQDKILKSPVRLREEGVERTSIGFRELGEPPEYEDYIHFGAIDKCHSEFVVLSQQRGRICTDENATYKPGVRLYLDCHRMISDQIGIRDGLHLLKVRSSLCLEPYLIAAVSTEEADPEGEVEVWTPKRFFEASTRYFQEKIVPEG